MNPQSGYQTDQLTGGPLASDPRLRQDLQATIGAQRELGPAYEAELIQSFLQHLDQSIDARIEQRQTQRRLPSTGRHHPASIAVPSLVFSIPLVAIAGGLAGGFGIFAVLFLVGFLNVYFDRWR